MTGPEWVEWGRAPRGRVWHLLSPVGGAHEAGAIHDAALCSLEHDIVDVVQGQPPRGARICTGCELRVEQLGRAVALTKTEGAARPAGADDPPPLTADQPDPDQCDQCPHGNGRHDPDDGSCDQCGCVNRALIEVEP